MGLFDRIIGTIVTTESLDYAKKTKDINYLIWALENAPAEKRAIAALFLGTVGDVRALDFLIKYSKGIDPMKLHLQHISPKMKESHGTQIQNARISLRQTQS